MLGVLCKARLFWDCICVDTHLPRYEALVYVLPHFDALTHVVIRVSSAFIFQTFAEVWYSIFLKFSSFKSFKVCWIFVKRTYFKSLLKVFHFKSLLKVFYRSPEGLLSICVHLSKVCWRSTRFLQKFAEGLLSVSKTRWVKFYFGLTLHIFQHDSSLPGHCLWKMCATPGASHCIKPGCLPGCLARRPLCRKVNLPSSVARRPVCHKVNLPSSVARRPLCHKVNLPSSVARRPLCHEVNLPSCVARWPLCHEVNLPSFVARRPLCHEVNLSSCVARRPGVVPQSKSTEFCSSAAVVLRSKSIELCSSAAVVPK